jgi:hypothetical protein
MILSVEGAFDFHVHAAPSLFERPYTAFQIAEEAAKQRMKGFVLKHHFEPSASRALSVQDAFPQLRVVGGVVLNRHVGGLNAFAVETAIKMGGRVVWMPTVDSRNHFQYFGRTSGYDEGLAGDGGPRMAGGVEGFERLASGPGLAVVDDSGTLIPAAKEIIEICKRHDVVLSTAHIGRDEAFAVARYASQIGHKRVMVGHALWKPLGLSIRDLQELAGMGVTIEFGASITLPIPGHAPPRTVVEAIYAIGPEHCILSSDAGAAVYPIAPEALRSYVQCLCDTGLKAADARRMMIENPMRLVGIS